MNIEDMIDDEIPCFNRKDRDENNDGKGGKDEDGTEKDISTPARRTLDRLHSLISCLYILISIVVEFDHHGDRVMVNNRRLLMDLLIRQGQLLRD